MLWREAIDEGIDSPPVTDGRLMHNALAKLLDRLDSDAIASTGVIPWGCPIPVFGDLTTARLATLGLNPSNKEFIDDSGNELEGSARRFHTLASLNLDTWAAADATHLRFIMDSWQHYFSANPYDRWFKRLDEVISGTGTSYYDASLSACHLDLIPYATSRKWGELGATERSILAAYSGDVLGLLMRDSPLRVLILNGRSVVDQFEIVANVTLQRRAMSSWSLMRTAGNPVPGIAYSGRITTFSDVDLRHEILVLGYNHNIQSSFGVTREAISAIRAWIAEETVGAFD